MPSPPLVKGAPASPTQLSADLEKRPAAGEDVALVTQPQLTENPKDIVEGDTLDIPAALAIVPSSKSAPSSSFPLISGPGVQTFEFVVEKARASDKTLGLDVRHIGYLLEVLRISNSGDVARANDKARSEGKHILELGDVIVRVNSTEGSDEALVEECGSVRVLNIRVVRGVTAKDIIRRHRMDVKNLGLSPADREGSLRVVSPSGIALPMGMLATAGPMPLTSPQMSARSNLSARSSAQDDYKQTCFASERSSRSELGVWAPPELPAGARHFEMVVTKTFSATDKTLGMDVRHFEPIMVVDDIFAYGDIQRCNAKAENQKPPGETLQVKDVIFRVNDVSGSCEKIVQECGARKVLTFHVIRGATPRDLLGVD